MKKIAFLLFFTVLIWGKYIDLGTYGKTYKILEPNFLKEVKEGVEKLYKEYPPERIRAMIKKQIEEQSVGHTSLPFSRKTTFNKYLNTYILQNNIYNPLGRIIHHRGEKMIIQNRIFVYMCYLAGNEPELKNEVTFFDKLLKKLDPNGQCTYIVAGESVFKLEKEMPQHTFYPARPFYEKRFHIKSYPTLTILKNQYIFNYTFSIEDFKHKGSK